MGPTLPTVANPSFSDEPAYGDDHLREKAIQNSMTLSLRSVHHTSFLWTLFQECERSTTQRFVAASGAGFPFSEIIGIKPRAFSFSRVVSESYPRSRWTVIRSGSDPSTSRMSRVSSKSG